MTRDIWSEVDRYETELVVRPDEALDAALAATDAAGLPAIAVSAPQGKLLNLLARMIGAKRVLEVGTLGGYSTIWLARALPPAPAGQVVSLEIEPRHAEVARKNVANAGLEDIVDIRVGAALDMLPALEPPFDVVFIDADKANIPAYFDWGVRLSRPGAVIVVDNVVRDGKVIDSTSGDANVAGVRSLNEALATDRRVSATTIQTVGSKGYDGFTLAVVL